jgi:MoxR-like ATPase
MAEKQVSVEGVTHQLSSPFLVLATQNPVEQEGTYPLPEAQMDRFAMKLSMGYPSKDEETEIMTRRLVRRHDAFDTKPVIAREDLLRMQKLVEGIHVDPSLVDYIARIVDGTRHHPDLVGGASPRGSLALLKLARAHAAVHGRRFMLPDDVRTYAVPCLAHRTIQTTDSRVRGLKRERIVQDILAKVPVPRTVTPG